MICEICKRPGSPKEKVKHNACEYNYGHDEYYDDEDEQFTHDKCPIEIYIWCEHCKHYTGPIKGE